MMKVLVLGGNGMLGHKIVQVLSGKLDVFSSIRGSFLDISRFGIFDESKITENLDIGDIDSVLTLVKTIRPEIVINCVGIIKQLPSSKNIVQALKINSLLPNQLAEIATEFGAKLITISTDCVFDGAKGNYTEDDLPNARDIYGKTKHLGEVFDSKHLTIRTSIIGRELSTSHSLIEWFLSNTGKKVNGFSNAIYSGFPTVVFADIICDLILNHPDLSGLHHVSSDPINKYDLLTLVKKHFQLEIEIENETEFMIDRSLDSSQFREITGFTPLSWDKMIEIMANDAAQYSRWR